VVSPLTGTLDCSSENPIITQAGGCQKSTDVCPGYSNGLQSGQPTKVTLIGGQAYLVVIVKNGATGGTTAELDIYSSVSVESEDFEGSSTSLPAGWTTQQGTNSRGWRIGTPNTLSDASWFCNATGDTSVGNIVGINEESGCTNNGGFPNSACDQSADLLFTPVINITASKPVALNVHYFFDNQVSLTIPKPKIYASVWAGVSANGNVSTWVNLGNFSSLNTAWQRSAYSLAAFANQLVQFKFEASGANGGGGGVAIADISISADSPICDDGIGCSQDTCVVNSGGAFGCQSNFSPDKSYAGACANTYTASCYNLTCVSPSAPGADSEGCVVAGVDSNCDDGVSCTNDTCSGSPTGGGTGCVNTPVDAACNDSNSCTIDKCDAKSGCSNTANCNDSVM
jgi:hypothetical protein